MSHPKHRVGRTLVPDALARDGDAPPVSDVPDTLDPDAFSDQPLRESEGLRAGRVVGRYVIEGPLGQGATARVVLVRHVELGTLYALKVLDASRPTLRHRTLREARIQATLRHPNVVRVHDMLEVDGLPALLMDHVDGPSLDAWLKVTRPEPDQVEALFRQVVAGVRSAHDEGVVHRDLKPSNVLLQAGPEGLVARVSDFGLAKTTSGVSQTRTGGAMGTPAYMAPEQVLDAKHVDHRADIYALGCILYELLAGRPAFAARDLPSLFERILEGRRPDPRVTVPGLDERLYRTIEAALEVRPEDRPQTCDDLLRVLEGEAHPSAEPEAALPDPDSRRLARALRHARAERQRAAEQGEPTAALDARVLELKLELRRRERSGGRPEAGMVLGDRFVLEEPIGRGGFAAVWRAWDDQGERSVAVKILHGQYAQDRTQVERFFRGARVMAGLDHPGVVRVIEPRGEDGELTWIAMEYLSGGDLRAAVREGRVQRAHVMRILRQLADALGFAHEHGLVHRDVKPQNVLLTEDGMARLADFDLVRARDSTGGTRSGGLGTFVYAAPEVMRDARNADERADIYALGMTALYCLHGADLPMDLVRDADRFIDDLGLGGPLAGVLKRAVAWDREERFPTMRAFAGALLVAFSAPAAPAPPPSPAPASSAAGAPSQTTLSLPAPPVEPQLEPPSVEPASPDPLLATTADAPEPVVGSALVVGADGQHELAPPAQDDGEPLRLAAPPPSPRRARPLRRKRDRPSLAPLGWAVVVLVGAIVAQRLLREPDEEAAPTNTASIDLSRYKVDEPRAVAPAEPSAAPAGAKGALSLNAAQPSRVTLDGEARGTTPLLLEDIAPGRYEVVLEASGGRSTRFEVDVEGGRLAFRTWDLYELSGGSRPLDRQAPSGRRPSAP